MWIRYEDEKLKEFIRLNSERSEFTGVGTHVLNEALSFDIETTSFYHGTDKCATMYVWALNFKGISIVGRTWQEFTSCLQIISDGYKLNDKRRIRIYVHNLSYEFQFMRKWFKWKKVFAVKAKTVLYAITESNIEFRCSYLLYGSKLEVLGKELVDKEINSGRSEKEAYDSISKLKYDYHLMRHSETPLSNEEVAYVVRDVEIVVKYINDCISTEGDITQIPLTKTGYVRRLCAERCFKHCYHYKSMIHCLNFKDYNEYKVAKLAFSGGFTHSNPNHTQEKLYNVSSFDFTSSYPAVMVSEKYPMSAGKLITKITRPMFERLMEEETCTVTLELLNVRAKFKHEYYISESKCEYVEGDIKKQGIDSKYSNYAQYGKFEYPKAISNGRIYQARHLKTTITSVDYRIISYVYDFDIVSVSNLYYYKSSYLPKPIIECILDLYENKTKLKGDKENLDLYMISKAMLNAIYGMTVTDILRNEYTYDSERSEWNPPTLLRDLPLDKRNYLIERENNKHSRFIFYLWGVFVTAYARFNLWTGIIEMKNDYIYSDTDSLKILHAEQHKDYFDYYNETITQKIDDALKFHNIDISRSRPKNKQLGVWDYEGTFVAFKTLGAKRYIYFDEDHCLHITIAGLAKKAGEQYLYDCAVKALDKDNIKRDLTIPIQEYILDMFRDSLVIPAGKTGKLTHTYINKEIEFPITDYLGNTMVIHELSYIHLEDCTFNLSMSYEFKAFLNEFAMKYYQKEVSQ